jgi:hypothetical protein
MPQALSAVERRIHARRQRAGDPAARLLHDAPEDASVIDEFPVSGTTLCFIDTARERTVA